MNSQVKRYIRGRSEGPEFRNISPLHLGCFTVQKGGCICQLVSMLNVVIWESLMEVSLHRHDCDHWWLTQSLVSLPAQRLWAAAESSSLRLSVVLPSGQPSSWSFIGTKSHFIRRKHTLSILSLRKFQGFQEL